MATYIETLTRANGDQIAPRTLTSAVSTPDGQNLDWLLQDYYPAKVELSGASGTLTDADFEAVTTYDQVLIINNGEYYRKADVTDGNIVFVHVGRDNQQQIFDRAIYVHVTSGTVNYKRWEKVSAQLATKDYVDGLIVTALNTGV